MNVEKGFNPNLVLGMLEAYCRAKALARRTDDGTIMVHHKTEYRPNPTDNPLLIQWSVKSYININAKNKDSVG